MLGLHFDRIPVLQRLFFVVSRFVAEHVRMTDDQLFADAVAHVVHIKGACLTLHFGVERHLQQHVAQLLLEQFGVLCVDGFDRFIGFFDKVGANGFMCLRHVPRTSAGCAQDLDNFNQIIKIVSFFLRVFHCLFISCLVV